MKEKMRGKENHIVIIMFGLVCAIVWAFLVFLSSQTTLMRWTCILFSLCDIALIIFLKKMGTTSSLAFIEKNRETLQRWSQAATAVLLILYSLPLLLSNALIRYILTELFFHFLLVYWYVQATHKPNMPFAIDACECVPTLATPICIFAICENLLPNILTYMTGILNLAIIIGACNHGQLSQTLDGKISGFVGKHSHLVWIAANTVFLLCYIVFLAMLFYALFRLVANPTARITDLSSYAGYAASAVNICGVVYAFGSRFLK